MSFSTNRMEFAVIHTGGKQYKVSVGDLVKIEKFKGDFKVGDKIVFDKVMLVDDGKDTTIGTPYIAKASVRTLSEIGRNKTVDVIKYKQKSRYFKKNGHRQPWFKVTITSNKIAKERTLSILFQCCRSPQSRLLFQQRIAASSYPCYLGSISIGNGLERP